jgi:hypothetical protein
MESAAIEENDDLLEVDMGVRDRTLDWRPQGFFRTEVPDGSKVSQQP